MAGRRPKLTPELLHEITTYIRAGAFDHVAAAAVGIARSTFYRWYNEGANARSRYAEFRAAVDQARAQARVRAETAVFREKPDTWLRYGPGRERPGAPGWTNLVRPAVDEIDDETLEAAAHKLAQKYGLDAEELLRNAGIIAHHRSRLAARARDPEVFVEAPDD